MTENEVINCTDKTKWLVCTDLFHHWFNFYDLELFCIVIPYLKWHWVTFVLSAGITVDKYGLIFFVDGTMIRRIDQNGIISTLLGFNDLTSARPLSCDAVMDISQVWPFCPLACDLLSTYSTLSDRPRSRSFRIPHFVPNGEAMLFYKLKVEAHQCSLCSYLTGMTLNLCYYTETLQTVLCSLSRQHSSAMLVLKCLI